MSRLQTEIINHIEKHGVRNLMENTKVGSSTIYSIKDWLENKWYRKKTLDSFYSFFKIPHDQFYFEKMENYKWNYDPLWIIFRAKRIQLWYSIWKVAKAIKWTDRHIRRIESWKVNYDISWYYFQELLKLYKFSKIERNKILSYSISLYDILELWKRESRKCPWIEQWK